MSSTNRNVVWPIVLIVLGVLFLAHNLDFIPFSRVKDILATWWPLILIALGIGALLGRNR
jgi:hypothetical protein